MVWTTDVFEFCHEMFEKCTLYFQRIDLPELCFGYWTDHEDRSAHQCEGSDDEVYYYCRKLEGGAAIKCDGKHCTWQWFHFSYLNMKRAPKAPKWYYCNECKSQVAKQS